jgi:hypothetical protein
LTLDDHGFEVGYVFLATTIKRLTDSYTVFLVIDAALALLPVWWVLRKENGCNPLSLAIFVSYYYTVNYLGSNRRIIAIGLCLLALIPLQNRKLNKFIVLCIVAFCFHRSSIIFFLAWPIFHGKLGKKSYAILAISIVFMIVWNPIVHILPMLPSNSSIVILHKLLFYSNNHGENPNINYALQNSLSLAKRGAFLLMILFGLSRIQDSEKAKYVGYINLYIFSLFLYVLFTGTVEIFKMVTIYFSIVEIFLVPRAISTISKDLRPIFYVMFILFIIAQQYSTLSAYWDLYVPYRSVLFGGI